MLAAIHAITLIDQGLSPVDKRRLGFLAGMIISSGFLFLAFRGLQPEQFWKSLSDIDLLILAAATLAYILAVVIIALRWQFLLRAFKLVALPALTQLVFIGYMGNNVYPLRAGDALRIFLLRRNHQVPLAPSTTVVVLERLFDGSVMLSFIFLSLQFIDLQSATIETITAVTAPLFVIALLVAFFLAAKPQLLRALISAVRRILPQSPGSAIYRLSEDIIVGLEGLRSPAFLLGAIVSSFVTWGIEAGTYWLVMQAFGLDLSYAVALLLVGAVNLAGLIPASPGQVGVNEFVIITILGALDQPVADATAYAVVTHLVIWLAPTVIGFMLLIRQGMGWADIRRARELESAAFVSVESN